MKKTILIMILVSCLLKVCAVEFLENIPAEIKFIACADMKKLTGSEFFKNYRKANPLDIDMPFGIFAMASGISVDEINKLWILGFGHEDGFFLMEGKFEPERIKQLFSSNNENEIIEMNDVLFAVMMPDQRKPGNKNLGVIIDDGTIAIGKRERIENFISVITGSMDKLSAQKSAELKKKFSEDSVIRCVLIEMPEETKDNSVAKFLVSGDMAIMVDKTIELTISADMTDEEIANATNNIIIGMMVYLRRLDFEMLKNPLAIMLKNELLKSFSSSVEGATVRIKMMATEEFLKTLIEERTKQRNKARGQEQ